MTPAETVIPQHSEIDPRYTWNAPSVFPSVEAWEAEFDAVAASLPGLAKFQGHLADGAAALSVTMEALQSLSRRVGILAAYAGMDSAVDTRNQPATKRYGRVQGLRGQFAAVAAFVGPELLAIGEERVRRWLAGDPQLAYLEHFVDDLFRNQAHVRSAEVEELMGLLAAPFANVEMTASMLTDADFKFPGATGIDGSEQAVTQGTLDRILAEADREARRTAWEGYMDTYLAHKNALASNLMTSVKNNVLTMRARRHASTLEMALFQQNLPAAVFDNLLEVFKKNLPTWHRYWEVRRKALGVETLQPYDIWAPLTGNRPAVSYEQAVDAICLGLAPMGQEYVETVRRGCLEQRWVDVYPCQGKMGGAFSDGSSGTHPFIMTSYTDEVFSLSTLAHELGHSMHSYLTWQNQPILYSDYSMFPAETASNFHQAMVRGYLLEANPDPAFQISVIEEAMSNFHRYFFIMPTLARFELAVHRAEERGEGMSADDMIDLMADLFAEGYGGGVHVDRERTGITWATFAHLYMDYYVFNYALGISAANALALRSAPVRPAQPTITCAL